MTDTLSTSYPVLPLRDIVVFPHMIVPLFVGREKSVRALEEVMADDKQILLSSQIDPSVDDPATDGIYKVGVLANVLQLLKLPDGTVKVLVEGKARVKITDFVENPAFFEARAEVLDELPGDREASEALVRAVAEEFERYAKIKKNIPEEALAAVSETREPARLADLVAGHLGIDVGLKQEMLETLDIAERLEKVYGQMQGEMSVLQVEKKIKTRVKSQMERTQREYYLNEQMKAIQKELGDGEDGQNEVAELEARIRKTAFSKEAREKAESELKKLKAMSPMSAEATVVRNYLDWLLSVPWGTKSRVKKDLGAAQKVLDADHYGLEKVKERIVEYLAVQQRVEKVKAPILCLVGPPGVGKTSLGQSIAKATNRKFVRMALGGMRDEAEIRGHRRTYIGSMPGKILQNMTKVGVKNPLFLLDEVDKLGMDFRGDPSSALLEVLDPEQNHTFQDHYVEVDFDLSDVMFVATANTLNIPPALLDRMEVIRLSGYTEDEKVNIAQRYLLPKQLKNNGVKREELTVTEDALRDIVRYYTREAGVRALERDLSKICRKVIKALVMKKRKNKIIVNAKNLDKFLGVRRYPFGMAEKENQVGQVTGLAWTEVGGELLTIESVAVPGKGKTLTTGKLGEVMQESIQAALTVVRRRSKQLGIPEDFYQKNDIHIHLPEGATPKDGPSAGIGMTTALVSTLSGIPVRADVAMTGEITLRGEVLPIGGLKEKLLAAVRGGIRLALIPEENVKDLTEIPDTIKGKIEIRPVKWIDQVLELALERMPEPLPEAKPAETIATKVADATDAAVVTH